MARYKKWMDENPEMMKKIPPQEEMVVSFPVRRDADTPFRWILGIIAVIPMFLFWGGRGGPMIDKGIEGMIGSAIFSLIMLAWMFFLGRKEKGHVDIYPEMIVFYDYDPDRREARPIRFYYWKDIVQYHSSDYYIWRFSKDNDPDNIWLGGGKLRPYLEQYAPDAEVVCFSMHNYFKKRTEQMTKARRAEAKAAREKEKEEKNKKKD